LKYIFKNKKQAKQNTLNGTKQQNEMFLNLGLKREIVAAL